VLITYPILDLLHVRLSRAFPLLARSEMSFTTNQLGTNPETGSQTVHKVIQANRELKAPDVGIIGAVQSNRRPSQPHVPGMCVEKD
jgi:hypothetical protein